MTSYYTQSESPEIYDNFDSSDDINYNYFLKNNFSGGQKDNMVSITNQTPQTYKPPPQPTPQLELKVYQPNTRAQSSTSAPKPQPFFTVDPYDVRESPSIISPPVINNITIEGSDPFQNHSRLASFIEYILPINNISSVASSIPDRLTLAQFIFETLLFNTNGLEINNLKYNIKSLLKSIKTTKLNPYLLKHFNSKLSPYQMPKNFIIFQSCFPIKFAQNQLMCDFNSVNINLRFYRIRQNEVKLKFDHEESLKVKAWADINFYNYVRSNILEKKESPNFAMMYGYNLYKDSEINFEEYEKKQQIKAQKKLTPTIDLDKLLGELKYDELKQKIEDYYMKKNIDINKVVHEYMVRYANLYLSKDKIDPNTAIDKKNSKKIMKNGINKNEI